jgi:hypothetical protein
LTYARRDGAPDALIIAYILEGFGVKVLSCFVFKVLDVLNSAFFLGAIVTLLKGLLSLIKGLKLLVTGTKSVIPISILEVLVPKRYVLPLGAFLVWVGSLEIVISGFIIFLTGIANNTALYLIAKGVCESDTAVYTTFKPPLSVGALAGSLDALREVLAEPGLSQKR